MDHNYSAKNILTIEDDIKKDTQVTEIITDMQLVACIKYWY